MTFTVKLGTENAAFGSSPQERGDEVARILRELADRIEGQSGSEELIRLRDFNGNRVGFATFNAAEEG